MAIRHRYTNSKWSSEGSFWGAAHQEARVLAERLARSHTMQHNTIHYNNVLIRNSSWTHSHRLHASFTLWKACEFNTSHRKCMTFHWLLPNVHLHVNRMHIPSGSDKTIYYYVHECAPLYPTETNCRRLCSCAIITARPQTIKVRISNSTQSTTLWKCIGLQIQYKAFYQECLLKRTAAQLSSRVANSNLRREEGGFHS